MSGEDDGPSRHKASSADYSGLIILAVLAVVEIAILYAVIALDTPLTPLVHRLLQNAAGVFTLVMCVVTILVAGMIIVLSWIEWRHKKRRDK